MENKLMTIMFLDMKGYTQRSAKQTIEEMKLFHDQMFAFVQENIEKWDGVMVKTMGDGFMVRFESPTNAVQAGLEIQKRLDARNAQMMNPENIVRFRIGINTGEVGIDENGDLFGDPVNIAARIQTFADPNDVFIAESTYLAMNRNEFGSVDLGSQELKNATREIKIYKVLKNGSPGVTLSSSKSRPAGLTYETKKKYLAMTGIVVAFFIIVILAFFIGRRKGRILKPNESQNTEQAQLNTEVKPAPATVSNPITTNTHTKPKNENKPQISDKKPSDFTTKKTLLDFPANTKSFHLNKSEQAIFNSLKQLRQQKNYAFAINKAKKAVKKVLLQKKIIFSLATAQLLWESGDKKTANAIFNKLLSSPRIKPDIKKKLIDAIETLKLI